MARTDWESGDFVDASDLNQLGADINEAEESDEIAELDISKQDKILRGSSTTAAGTVAKTATLTNAIHVPLDGEIFLIEFTNGNTVGDITLNINGSGALPVVGPTGLTSWTGVSLAAGVEILVLKDGSNYRFLTGSTVAYTSVSVAQLQAGSSMAAQLVTAQILAQATLIVATTAPGSASGAGRAGQFYVDGTYLYLCVANNTWRRIAHSSW